MVFGLRGRNGHHVRQPAEAVRRSALETVRGRITTGKTALGTGMKELNVELNLVQVRCISNYCVELPLTISGRH